VFIASLMCIRYVEKSMGIVEEVVIKEETEVNVAAASEVGPS